MQTYDRRRDERLTNGSFTYVHNGRVSFALLILFYISNLSIFYYSLNLRFVTHTVRFLWTVYRLSRTRSLHEKQAKIFHINHRVSYPSVYVDTFSELEVKITLT